MASAVIADTLVERLRAIFEESKRWLDFRDTQFRAALDCSLRLMEIEGGLTPEPLERPNTTVAEGLSTRTAFELPQRILREMLDDFVLVSDENLLAAVRIMIEKTRTLVEPAGAAALAAAMSPSVAPRLGGRCIALICSGGNISPTQLRLVLSDR